MPPTVNRIHPISQRWASCLVGLTTFLVFLPTLRYPFLLWDDDTHIVHNPLIRVFDVQHIGLLFSTADALGRYLYLPLTWLGYSINYQISGLQPWSYHLANILLHSLNAGLVCSLILELLRRAHSGKEMEDPVALMGSAVIGAFFWSLHPLRVEAVAWVSARGHPQSLLFALASILLYLKGGRFYFGSVIFFALALLSYPTVIGLVGALIFVYFLRWPKRSARQCLIEAVPFVGVAFISISLNGWLRWRSYGLRHPAASFVELTAMQRLMQAFYVWAYYLWKSFLPFHLSPVYPSLRTFSSSSSFFILSAILILGISGFMILRWSRYFEAPKLWFCYLLLMIPFLGVTEAAYSPQDRYAYLPTVCLSVGLSSGLLKVWRSRRRIPKIAIALSVLTLVLGTGLSMVQCKIWRSNIALFQHALGGLPEGRSSNDLYWRLGAGYLEAGDPTQAIIYLNRTLARVPDQPAALFYRGLARISQGDFDAAVEDFRTSQKISPSPITQAYLERTLQLLHRREG